MQPKVTATRMEPGPVEKAWDGEREGRGSKIWAVMTQGDLWDNRRDVRQAAGCKCLAAGRGWARGHQETN